LTRLAKRRLSESRNRFVEHGHWVNYSVARGENIGNITG
jgi:hypothetical protein